MTNETEHVRIQKTRKGDLAGFTFTGGLDSRSKTHLFFADSRKPGRFDEVREGEEWRVEILSNKRNLHWCRFIEPVQEMEAREKAAGEARAAAFLEMMKQPRVAFNGRGFNFFNIPDSPGFTKDRELAEKVAAELGIQIQGL